VPEKSPPFYRAFAVTKYRQCRWSHGLVDIAVHVRSSDGSILVCGGKSSYLQIWNLETHKLIKIIELPKSIKEIKDMAFVSESFDGGSHKVDRDASDRMIDMP
jgi:WD40 repeat protein